MASYMNNNYTPGLLLLLLVMPVLFIVSCGKEPPKLTAKHEIVMSKGMLISTTNSYGTLKISAGEETTRSYTWDGVTRTATLWPRDERWYGSLGIYFPGPMNHWKNHKGITRGLLEEGQQHFKSMDEAISWLENWPNIPCTYRDDGLVVCWGIMKRENSTTGNALVSYVWQIYINGERPENIPGSNNSSITVSSRD